MSCAPVNNSERVFSYSGLTVLVSSNDPSHLTWLEEFMSPQFDVVEGLPHVCRVSLTADTRRFEEILEGGTRPDGAKVACFALERGMVWLPLWKSLDGNQIIYDERFRVFYFLNKEAAEIDLLVPANNMNARIALMRVVREFGMNHAHRTGHLVIHGSAFVVKGLGVILAGPKGAGKTSLLIHVLRDGTAEFLSNDRAVVSFEETGSKLRGMPTIVAVRHQTLEMFPPLRARLLASSHHPRFTLRERAQGASRPVRPGADGTFSLSPAQFCELLQACPVAHGRLQAIVFPKVTGESGTIHLERLSGEVAASRLAESLFKTGPSQVTSRVFDQSGDDFQTDQVMLDRLCRRLTSKVRCFECCLGEEAYESKASATAFIQHVMGDLDIGREMYGSPGIAQGE